MTETYHSSTDTAASRYRENIEYSRAYYCSDTDVTFGDERADRVYEQFRCRRRRGHKGSTRHVLGHRKCWNWSLKLCRNHQEIPPASTNKPIDLEAFRNHQEILNTSFLSSTSEMPFLKYNSENILRLIEVII